MGRACGGVVIGINRGCPLYSSGPGLRLDPANKETGGGGRGPWYSRGGGLSGSQASHIRWCVCSNNSLGSSRPSFASGMPGESLLSSNAESNLIVNSGRTSPPLSAGSAVARILLPTGTARWVGRGSCVLNNQNRVREPCLVSRQSPTYRFHRVPP